MIIRYIIIPTYSIICASPSASIEMLMVQFNDEIFFARYSNIIAIDTSKDGLLEHFRNLVLYSQIMV